MTPTSQSFNYGYYPDSDNRKYVKRTWTGLGEVFTYDLADQVTAVQHNIANPDTTPTPTPNITYDFNGNRIWYTPTGVNKHYDVNGTASNLNQYNNVRINGFPFNLSYGSNANLAHYDKNNSSYSYDAQNRLTSATVAGQTMYFDYDGLNRQVSWRLGANGTRTFNVWDGWDLIEEYQAANNGVMTAFYLYGATGLIAGATNGEFHYYFQDGSGSTSHLTDGSGSVLEWYRYDVDGTPIVNDDPNNHASAKGVRHLFTGQQWCQDLGLYDLRNRFYSPDLGRFLQPDPIGFSGDATNLYRYCGNNPVMRKDPFGLTVAPTRVDPSPQYPQVTLEPVKVTGTFPNSPAGRGGLLPPGLFGGNHGLGGGGGGFGGRLVLDGFSREFHWPSRNTNSTTPQQPPPQNPPLPNVFGNFGAGPPGILTVGVATVIENGFEPGLKSYQWATVNVLGQITNKGDYIGVTYDPVSGRAYEGSGYFQAWSEPGFPGPNIFLQGHVWSAFLGESFAIDYQFRIAVSWVSGTATLRGIHDGYPSYFIMANDNPLYYYREGILLDLLQPMEVRAGGL